MNERDIERAAIDEILEEAKINEKRNKPQEWPRFCINKRLFSRNLVSTLRNPVFSRNLRKRRILSLDDETGDEDDEKHKKQKYDGNGHHNNDDYIYDAREYFDPKKYREIIAYRNRKRHVSKWLRGRKKGCTSDQAYNTGKYHSTHFDCSKCEKHANNRCKIRTACENSSDEQLWNKSTDRLLASDDTGDNDAVCVNHRKKNRHKQRKIGEHLKQKKRGKKSKHRVECKSKHRQEDTDKISKKRAKYKTEEHTISQHKSNKKSKKQCESSGQDDFCKFRTDTPCLRNEMNEIRSDLTYEETSGSQNCYSVSDSEISFPAGHYHDGSRTTKAEYTVDAALEFILGTSFSSNTTCEFNQRCYTAVKNDNSSAEYTVDAALEYILGSSVYSDSTSEFNQ